MPPKFISRFIDAEIKDPLVARIKDYVAHHKAFDAEIAAIVLEGEVFHFGHFTPPEVLRAVRIIWPKIAEELRRDGVRMDDPTDDEVRDVMREVDVSHTPTGALEKSELGDFVKLLLIRQAQRWLKSNAKKYAIGACLGVVAVAIAKAIIRHDVPLIGGLTMRLVPPAIFIGPLVGIAGTFIKENGGWKKTRQIGWVDNGLRHARPWMASEFQTAKHLVAEHWPPLGMGATPSVYGRPAARTLRGF